MSRNILRSRNLVSEASVSKGAKRKSVNSSNLKRSMNKTKRQCGEGYVSKSGNNVLSKIFTLITKLMLSVVRKTAANLFL